MANHIGFAVNLCHLHGRPGDNSTFPIGRDSSGSKLDVQSKRYATISNTRDCMRLNLWLIPNLFKYILMPVPIPNETEEGFINRCIPVVINDGSARNTAQAYAMCLYIYQNKQNGISINQNNQTEPEEPEDN
jgi:hypothetical protein